MNKQSLMFHNKLKQKYDQEIAPKLAKEFGDINFLAVPKLIKIVVNMGVKEMAKDKGQIDKIMTELADIVGQKPKLCRAKKSIASFKLVKNEPIGLKATLRGERMYDFFSKLVMSVLARTRDFHGVSLKSFDGNGNFSLGFSEQIIFPEIDYGKLSKVRGLEVTIVTNARDDKKAKRLLEELGMPFEKTE